MLKKIDVYPGSNFYLIDNAHLNKHILRGTFLFYNVRYLFKLARCHEYSTSSQNRRYNSHVWNKESDTFWRYSLYSSNNLTRLSIIIFALDSLMKFLACNFISISIILIKENMYHLDLLVVVTNLLIDTIRPHWLLLKVCHIFTWYFVFLPYSFLPFFKTMKNKLKVT